MFPKAHLTSHSTISSSRWVITPLRLSGSWRSFFVFFCVFLPPLINIFCFCQVHPFSVLYCVHLCMKSSLDISTFLDNISLGHHHALAPSMLYPASDIDWRFSSYMILYMLECHSPKSSHPLPLSPKVHYTQLCLFLLSCIQGRHCHLSKFHIYVLVYCIGVFLSGLLHSV